MSGQWRRARRRNKERRAGRFRRIRPGAMPIPPVDTLVKYESPIMVRLRSLRAPNRTPPALPPRTTSHRVREPSVALARRDGRVAVADRPLPFTTRRSPPRKTRASRKAPRYVASRANAPFSGGGRPGETPSSRVKRGRPLIWHPEETLDPRPPRVGLPGRTAAECARRDVDAPTVLALSPRAARESARRSSRKRPPPRRPRLRIRPILIITFLPSVQNVRANRNRRSPSRRRTRARRLPRSRRRTF